MRPIYNWQGWWIAFDAGWHHQYWHVVISDPGYYSKVKRGGIRHLLACRLAHRQADGKRTRPI